MRSASERGLRIAGAVLGGYLLSALAVLAAGALFARAGLAPSESVALASMLGFVFYLVLLVWAFGVRSAKRLWLTLASGAALMAAVLVVAR